ncbi:acetyltransferase [Candidatus Methanoperedens nitroreducens]|uniref:Acetyltransferase n=1 Tax=Candidatus Methanoperedens nitratireducens TaxID=1392998 RepID=A0A062V824_9EURY|nr:N-acetyltransferase [Candidatus Methanoperedens nitroreducens]KCZ71520.1 acetyltransferase [Candidatus Methanoperedens nitroreducens]
MKQHIRLAKKEDLPELVDLENICFKEDTFNKKQLEYLLLRAKSLVIVVSVDGKIIGSVIILLRAHISHARIYSLNVHPGYRRSGIGSLLMDTALKLLKERGTEKVTLEVEVNNRAAQDLYYSKDFYIDKMLKNYYKNGEDAVHLVKRL